MNKSEKLQLRAATLTALICHTELLMSLSNKMIDVLNNNESINTDKLKEELSKLQIDIARLNEAIDKEGEK